MNSGDVRVEVDIGSQFIVTFGWSQKDPARISRSNGASGREWLGPLGPRRKFVTDGKEARQSLLRGRLPFFSTNANLSAGFGE